MERTFYSGSGLNVPWARLDQSSMPTKEPGSDRTRLPNHRPEARTHIFVH
ncbi:hypothetical protein MAPG_05545 [Magnaporthiopsis poae ATCC 64411]|uniref:Uncharacterized protein n=1 Tax=Magnaporthiopsis poae (strain ATCC 64411 / 73-15) TaxID=644358 RepID=A0A0C4DZN9_MAGP6|nr:hypothetical protein MAPG_05545 [Magnaporthiopsis poae ATCC 64411]